GEHGGTGTGVDQLTVEGGADGPGTGTRRIRLDDVHRLALAVGGPAQPLPVRPPRGYHGEAGVHLAAAAVRGDRLLRPGRDITDGQAVVDDGEAVAAAERDPGTVRRPRPRTVRAQPGGEITGLPGPGGGRLRGAGTPAGGGEQRLGGTAGGGYLEDAVQSGAAGRLERQPPAVRGPGGAAGRVAGQRGPAGTGRIDR